MTELAPQRASAPRLLTLLDCKVEAYERANDGALADEHCFLIRVWCERTYTYEINRSASDLVRLSHSLLKRFPRAGLSGVPIMGCIRPRRQLALGGGVGMALVNTGKHSIAPRNSAKHFGANGGRSTCRRAVNSTKASSTTLVVCDARDAESLASYKQSIEVWLRSLLCIPEVVGSDEFVTWLADDPLWEEEELVTEVDYALEDEPVNKVVVRHGSSHGIKLDVPRGHFVVWSFASKPRDVAFSVECDGREARTYERVPSHERLFQGVWENPASASCGRLEDVDDDEGVDVDALVNSVVLGSEVTIRWGNEYARWRDKRVYYQIAVLSKEAIELARRRYKQKTEVEAERDAHRDALERVAKQLSEHHRGDDEENEEDDLASVASTIASAPASSRKIDEWRALPRRELEAAALNATTKVETLADALTRLEREATLAARERDDARSEASACRVHAEDAERRASESAAAAQAERRERERAKQAESTARAELIECQDAMERLTEQLSDSARQLAALRRERDLLAEAARGYKDSAELARGDARSVRDELASARDALAVLNHNSPVAVDNPEMRLDDDDDDDLLQRVDALQSRIDSELGRVLDPPPPPPKPNTRALRHNKPLLDEISPTPPTQGQRHPRRHDLVVKPGYGPGEEMPFRVEGMDLSVVVPHGLRPGDTFTIELR